MVSTKYYKGFDHRLCGYGDTQYKVGKDYIVGEADNSWNWAHCSKYVSSCLIYFDSNVRVCEIEPLGPPRERKFFSCSSDGYGKGYYTAHHIRIIRELTRDEIFQRMLEEKAPLFLFIASCTI